jgi:hypothetical protein
LSEDVDGCFTTLALEAATCCARKASGERRDVRRETCR